MTVALDSPISKAEIIRAVGGVGEAEDDAPIEKIATDSRECSQGSLFIAVSGKDTSGERFISDAKGRGAITLGVSDEADIRVSDTEKALLSLAAYYKESHLKSLKHTLAITGSVGKTTTKEFLYKLLSAWHKTHANLGNYNNTLGVPLTVLSAPRDTEILICELGMNSLGEIGRLARCIRPDAAVITNIGTAHIGRLGSREKIAEAKLEVLEGMRTGAALFVPYGEELLKSASGKTFSAASRLANMAVIGDGNLEIFSQGKRIGEASFNLTGHHHRECLAAALSLACFVSSPEKIFPVIQKISTSEIRERIYKVENFYLLDDSYNASYESINASLAHLFSLSGYKARSVLLGDVLELGSFSAEIHIKIGRLLARFSPKEVYLYGDYAQYTRRGAESMGMEKSNIHVFGLGEGAALAELVKKLTVDSEIILVKGSHGMSLGKIIEYIRLKKPKLKG